jgi:DNA-binding FadR family transcriptional regulator
MSERPADAMAGVLLTASVTNGQSKAARLAAALERKIHAEKLPPGSFLATKATLREQAAVSASTLDSALKLLTERGVISLRPGVGGGIHVARGESALLLARSKWSLRSAAGIPSETAPKAAALMLILWPLVVADAATTLTSTGKKKLLKSLDDLESSIGDHEGYYRAHDQLHHAWLEVANDPVLHSVFLSLNEVAERAPETPPSLPEGLTVEEYTKERFAVHRRIVEMIVAGNVHGAWLALLDHGITESDLEADRAILPAGFILTSKQWARGVREAAE